MQLTCGPRLLDLSVPQVMGVLNTTPDSFSDGGRYYRDGSLALDLALEQGRRMVEEGASIIDVGGESTRPGAAPVSLDEERRRVLPVVEALAAGVDAVISVDTSRPEIMREAAALGAGLINDVRALQREGALQAAAETGLPVCLMHMQGAPTTMQRDPRYDDVVAEVTEFLARRVLACENAGIGRGRLLLDPGFGFGKNDAHNLTLLRHLDRLSGLELPLVAGLSRKSMIGRLLGRDVHERLPASLGLALIALQKGARVLRVHDVAPTRDLVEVFRLTATDSPGAGERTSKNISNTGTR